jgi:hypothetical protein
MIINIDFDGTCVSHRFPAIGKDIGAAPVLRALVDEGHKLILWTVRSDVEAPQADSEHPEIIPKGGLYLTEATNWFLERSIPLWGVNENPTQKTWTHSPKAYAHFTIDDTALGCPLFKFEGEPKPFVDWWSMTMILAKKGLLNPSNNMDLGTQLMEACEFNFSQTNFKHL